MNFFILALTLLVLGILTDNHDFSLTLDNFALFANLFDRRPDFHNIIIPFTRSSVGEIQSERLCSDYLLRHVMRPLVRSYGDI